MLLIFSLLDNGKPTHKMLGGSQWIQLNNSEGHWKKQNITQQQKQTLKICHKSSPSFYYASPIFSLCILSICRATCIFCLARYGQYGQWNWGSIPHSHFSWFLSELFSLYPRPHRGHMKLLGLSFPREDTSNEAECGTAPRSRAGTDGCAADHASQSRTLLECGEFLRLPKTWSRKGLIYALQMKNNHIQVLVEMP